MKCTHCGFELQGTTVIVGIVSGARVYGANYHIRCARALVGKPSWDKLELATMKAGWSQPVLPGWEAVV